MVIGGREASRPRRKMVVAGKIELSMVYALLAHLIVNVALHLLLLFFFFLLSTTATGVLSFWDIISAM